MSVDVDKPELLHRLAEEYHQLAALIDRLTPDQMLQPNAIGSLSIKDLLAHLIAHEQRALQEVRAAQQGRQLAIDHATTDAFNAGAVAASTPHDATVVRAAWERSYRQVVALVEALREEDFLPTSRVIGILEDSIDGAIGNNTYGHYAEHRPEVEAWMRRLQDQPAESCTG